MNLRKVWFVSYSECRQNERLKVFRHHILSCECHPVVSVPSCPIGAILSYTCHSVHWLPSYYIDGMEAIVPWVTYCPIDAILSYVQNPAPWVPSSPLGVILFSGCHPILQMPSCPMGAILSGLGVPSFPMCTILSYGCHPPMGATLFHGLPLIHPSYAGLDSITGQLTSNKKPIKTHTKHRKEHNSDKSF